MSKGDLLPVYRSIGVRARCHQASREILPPLKIRLMGQVGLIVRDHVQHLARAAPRGIGLMRNARGHRAFTNSRWVQVTPARDCLSGWIPGAGSGRVPGRELGPARWSRRPGPRPRSASRRRVGALTSLPPTVPAGSGAPPRRQLLSLDVGDVTALRRPHHLAAARADGSFPPRSCTGLGGGHPAPPL
jgi:hypothetical protein